MTDLARIPLRRFERWQGIAFLMLVLVFAYFVEVRSAFLSRRMGDFGVYARAAWAVKSGNDLYKITDENDWHYIYPPIFAILLVPFADAPPTLAETPLVPYAVAVGVWFLLSVTCLVWGVTNLTRALEETLADADMADQPRFCRRWWALRVWPMAVCLVPIGHTLMRGQVNLLVLGFLCAMMAAFLRRQSFRAGVWLSLACAIKVIPAFLVIYPLLRRDWRCLRGLAVGLAVTLGLIPVLVYGPGATVRLYQEYADTLLGPALGVSKNPLLDKELLGTGSTDNQSLKVAFFNACYLDASTRPPVLPAWAEWTYRILGLLMMIVTVAAGVKSGLRDGLSQVMFVGTLLFLMAVLSPVCHLHYFTYLLPMILALFAQRWEFRKDLGVGLEFYVLFGLFFVSNLLPHLPGLGILRDAGLPLYTGTAIWGLAIVRLWRSSADFGPLRGPFVTLGE